MYIRATAILPPQCSLFASGAAVFGTRQCLVASPPLLPADLANMLSRKKGPRKPSKSASSSFAGPSPAAGEDHQINLLDSGAVKRELDEGAIRVTFKSPSTGSRLRTLPRSVQRRLLAVCRLPKGLVCKRTTLSAMSRLYWVW